MHRIDGAGHVDHLFVAEDPATLRPPTEITPEIMNAFQEELATFIEWAGIVLAKGDNTQLKQALVAKFAGLDVAATKAGVQGQAYTAFTTAGATGAFTLAPAPAIAAYAAGQRFRVKFHAAGNGADTINVSGLGAKNLKQFDSSGSKAAPVIAAGQLVDVEYDGVDMVLLDPLPPTVPAAVPSGSVIFVAQSSPPSGYLKANGSAVSRATYASLFAAIGTTFGAGDGATTFNLPDLRGEFIRGFDDGRGADSGRAFGSWQVATAFMGDGDGQNIATPNLNDAAHRTVLGFDLDTTPANSTNITLNFPSNSGSSSVNGMHSVGGANIATDFARTRPRNVALLACIKF